MREFFKNIFYLLLIILINSCATSSLKMAKADMNWNDFMPPQSTEIYHSIYLIGDVGGAEQGASTIPLIELKKHLLEDDRKDQSTDVVFLGDNIYPVGMPPVDHKDRALAEHRLNVQLESVREFAGNVTFVPGNHDWYEYGREGLKRQEEYIENYLSKYGEGFTDYFRPSDGCGNIDVMKIADDIELVSIDSHWFLTDKEEEYDFSDCEIKNRQQFVEAFKDTMAVLQNKKVMLTMHHPLYTVGKHGGYYSKKTFWLPFTQVNSKLILPQPIVGLMQGILRSKISPQDVNSAPYASYRKYVIPPIESHGQTIVAAGHEHTLQYHKINGVDYIVSGSGSKQGATRMKDYTRFAYGNYGYGLVDYYNDGSIWLAFYAQKEHEEDFGLVYRSKLK